MSVTTVPAQTATASGAGTVAPLIADVHGVLDEFATDSWIDAAIRGGNSGTGAGGGDPLAPVLRSGLPWLVDAVRPLSQALASVTGAPEQAQAWTGSMSGAGSTLTGASGGLRDAAGATTGDWSGAAADAYRLQIDARCDVLAGLGTAATGTAAMSEAASGLVSQVRAAVCDQLGQFVDQLRTLLPQWLSEQPSPNALGPGGIVVVLVRALVARFAGLILRLLQALARSVGKLRGLLNRLGEAVKAIWRYIRGRRNSPPEQEPAPNPPKPPEQAPAPNPPKPPEPGQPPKPGQQHWPEDHELTEEQKWQQMEDALKKQQEQQSPPRPGAPGQPAEVFNNVRDAIGETQDPLVLDKVRTNNPSLREQGYTETWYVEDSHGTQWTVHRNPGTGQFTGAHHSSSNY